MQIPSRACKDPMRLPSPDYQLPEGRDFVQSLVYPQNLGECPAYSRCSIRWMSVGWMICSFLPLSDFTLNPIPSYFLCSITFASVLQTHWVQTRLGVLTLTVPFAGNALPSNLGRASSFYYSCFSSKVIIPARPSLISLSDGSSHLYHIILFYCFHLSSCLFVYLTVVSLFPLEYKLHEDRDLVCILSA